MAAGQPEFAPRKLTEEEARAQAEAERQGNPTGASAWNHAGTFEERAVTGWAQSRLKELLAGVSGGGAKVTEVVSSTGEAHIWFVRGKKRAGFEFELKLAWTFDAPSGSAVKGSLKVSEAASDDLDDMTAKAEVEGKPAAQDAAAAARAAEALLPAVRSRLEQLLEELKER